jgi:virulence-associated protein VagC
MKTAELVDIEGVQAVKLPDEFRFAGPAVSIRKSGEAVILEPVRSVSWPDGFFDEIKIDDPAFARPDQGTTPPAPSWS